MLFLGLLFVIIGIVSDGMYVLLASAIAARLRRDARARRIRRRFSGGVYIGLAATTALAGEKP